MAKNNDTVVLENDDNHDHVKINDANKDGTAIIGNLMLGLPTRKSLARHLINLIWNHFLLGLVTLKNINEEADNGELVGSPQVVQETQMYINNVDLVFENVDDINSIFAEVQQDMKILKRNCAYMVEEENNIVHNIKDEYEVLNGKLISDTSESQKRKNEDAQMK